MDYSPSISYPRKDPSVSFEEVKLPQSIMKRWTPASSNHQGGDYSTVDMAESLSQDLEGFKSDESNSSKTFEGSFNMYDLSTSTREYSLRQTYSFLTEMSSSGSQLCPLPWSDSPKKIRKVVKSSRTGTPSRDLAREIPPQKYKQTGSISTDETRQLHLNRNRIAAAKCRVNKNAETQRLREAVHTYVAINNRLKQEVMDKMEEIQLLHTEVLCHVVDSGCRAPSELRAILGPNKGPELLQGELELADEEDNIATNSSLREPRAQSLEMSPDSARRRSNAPSPGRGSNHFAHGSIAHQRVTQKLRAQHAQCSDHVRGICIATEAVSK